MTQQIRGMLVCLLVLSTIVGCGKTTPEATTTPQGTQGKTTSQSATVPQDGWKEIAGQGVTLSLPANYEGGNPSTDLDEITQKLKAIAPSYAQGMEVIKQNPDAIALLAFDPQSGKTGFLTNVNITKEDVPQDVTVEQYLQAASQQIASRYKVLELRHVIPLDQYQAGRIMAEAKAGEITIKQLFYAVKNDNKFWLVMYSTNSAEFDKRLPNFEQSIRTFKVSQ
jgi:serine/threonine-protein kinase